MALFGAYSTLAPLYDVLSLEWPVYAAGRRAGVDALDLKPGDRVLDVGCGTGLSFPLLYDAVGDQGRIVGLDASRQMLNRAGTRARASGWTNVRLGRADATEYDVEVARTLLGPRDELGAADAILFVYSLSLMPAWPEAWARTLQLARPGARIAIVDMQLPTGRARVFGPLSRLACAAGGSDIGAHPWTVLERDLTDVSATSLRGGHIQVRAGRVKK